MTDGYGDVCFYCGEQCSNLAANPLWALMLPLDKKRPGLPIAVHIGCVLKRLTADPQTIGETTDPRVLEIIDGLKDALADARAERDAYMASYEQKCTELTKAEDALRHLGNVLYAVADTPQGKRCEALESALLFYNECCPKNQIEWVSMAEPQPSQSAMEIINRCKGYISSGLPKTADAMIAKELAAALERARREALEQAATVADEASHLDACQPTDRITRSSRMGSIGAAIRKLV